MKYIEKPFQLPEKKDENWQYPKIPKWMPLSVVSMIAKKSIGEIRGGMGGTSADITKRTITQTDKMIRGYKDDIRIRIYRPEEDGPPRKCQIFMHGGGWIGGTIDAVEQYCRAIADRADAVVISVDYHLAPEYPYPCGLTDSYAALLWAWDNAEELGVDREKFSVSGDSAGGNFAAVMAIMARDEGRIKLDRQVLLYPVTTVTDDGLFESADGNYSAAVLGRLLNLWYMGRKGDVKNPKISPMYADLKGLPKSLTVVCEMDPLRFQGKKFAEKLSEAGVDSTCFMYLNTPHAFIDDTGTLPRAEDLIDEVAAFLA